MVKAQARRARGASSRIKFPFDDGRGAAGTISARPWEAIGKRKTWERTVRQSESGDAAQKMIAEALLHESISERSVKGRLIRT